MRFRSATKASLVKPPMWIISPQKLSGSFWHVCFIFRDVKYVLRRDEIIANVTCL